MILPSVTVTVVSPLYPEVLLSVTIAPTGNSTSSPASPTAAGTVPVAVIVPPFTSTVPFLYLKFF